MNRATIASLAVPGGFHDGDWVESKDQDPEGDIRLLQLADVGDGRFRDRSDRWVNEETFHRLQCSWVRPGDVLIARMPDPLGRACLVPAGLGRTITVVDVAVLRCDPNRADPRYVTYAINSLETRGFVECQQDGATRQRIPRKRLGRVHVPAPALTAQRAIADYLDRETTKIDTLVEEQQRLIEMLLERRQATVDRLVWSGLERVPQGRTGIDLVQESPAHWRRLRNKNILNESQSVSAHGDEELLSVSHITGVTPRSEKNVTMIEAESLEGYRLVEPGDLVINTMWAWMGALGVSRHHGVVSPAYGVYRPHAGADFHPAYFDYLYRSRPYVVELTRHSRGIWTSRLRIYPEVFLRLHIVVPPLDEQRAIANHLDEQTEKIDELIAETERFIELSSERRAALITAAVTGQIDVRDRVHGGAA